MVVQPREREMEPRGPDETISTKTFYNIGSEVDPSESNVTGKAVSMAVRGLQRDHHQSH